MFADKSLVYVETVADIQASVATFLDTASQHPELARDLVERTGYWVYQPDEGTFAPSKFVAFKGMSFPLYAWSKEQQRESGTVKNKFDGHNTWPKIRKALQADYLPRPDLVGLLKAWAADLLDADDLVYRQEQAFVFIELRQASGKRNPSWRREELILALDYYLSHPHNEHGAGHPGIIELSEILNKLPFHLDRPDSGRFRNPNGCEMKLCNFRAFDPNYDGKGLDAGSKLDKAIWDEFYGDQERLHREAETIRALISNPEALAEVSQHQDGEEEFEEGALRYRMHRARERNSALVEKAKKTWLAKDPLLPCECCGFSFKEKYGVDFIEAHHRKPISELDGVTKTKVEDLMPVCANCHRMLHSSSTVILY